MNKYVSEFLQMLGLYAVIAIIWQELELLTTGTITVTWADTLVGLILTISLYHNFEDEK